MADREVSGPAVGKPRLRQVQGHVALDTDRRIQTLKFIVSDDPPWIHEEECFPSRRVYHAG